MRATIEIKNVLHAKVTGVRFEHLAELDEMFAIDIPNAEHIKRRARMAGQHWAKDWDGKQHLFNVQTGTFPVGLTWRVRKVLRGHKYKVTVQDSRQCAKEAPAALQRVSEDMLQGIRLRDYQLNGVRKALQRKGGVFQLATNAGKTGVGAALYKAIDKPTLYMVPNTKLIAQTQKEFARFLGIEPSQIGVIKGGVFDLKKLTIGIVNSLQGGPAPKYRKPNKALIQKALADDGFDAPPEGEDFDKYIRALGTQILKERHKAWAARKKAIREYLRSVEVLIIDECHHSAARTWMKVAKQLGASWRFGLSATPFNRTDGKSINVLATCGPVVARVTNKELIERGLSAKPTIYVRQVGRAEDPNGKEVEVDGRYSDVYKQGVTHNVHFHRMIVEDTLKHVEADRPTLVLVKELEHGHALVEAFDNEGFGRVEFVYGEMDDETIEQAKENFSKGRTKVLIASPVFGEGQHIPEIRGLVLADDFKSVILILQRIGRGLRKKTGKNKLYVSEYAHTTHRYLADHSLSRLETYEKEGFKIVEV